MSSLKRGLVRAVAHVLFYLGLLHLLLWLEGLFGHKRTVWVLCYHSIVDRPLVPPLSGMEAGTAVEHFEVQCATLRDWLISPTEYQLRDWLDGKENLPADGLMVTFDDGYRNAGTIAWPILRRLGITGVVYIATDYIETTNRYWWDRLSTALRWMTPTAWRNLATPLLPQWLNDIIRNEDLLSWESRRRARQQIAIRLEAEGSIDDVLTSLEANVAVPPGSDPSPLLTWDEITTLDAEGLCFGGHTHTHPRLTHLEDAQIAVEVRHCYSVLAERLPSPPRSFAYPSGDFNDRVVAHLQRSQYQLAFTTQPGAVYQSSSPYALPRFYFGPRNRVMITFALAVFKVAKYGPSTVQRLATRLITSVF